MKITVEKAALSHLEEIGRLYDTLCDQLRSGRNYPGWQKGVYPTAADAERGIREGALYIAKAEGEIAGTVILRHTPEEGYQTVRWLSESDYGRIYVLYTLAVHPRWQRRGVGERLLRFAEEKARAEGCLSLRLDVARGNEPAERLYRRCGFQYVGAASLGYEAYGLPWFELYEKML